MKARPKLLDRMFWNAYNRYWDTRDRNEEVQGRVEDAVNRLSQNGAQPPQSVLDAGCGTGIYTLALAQLGFQATGIDFSSSAISRASQKATEMKLAANFEKMDLSKMLWYGDEQFDHTLCAAVLHWSQRPAELLQELKRVTRSGGLLVVTVWLDPARHRQAYPQLFENNQPVAQPPLRDRMLKRVKDVAERNGNARYWTRDEFSALLTAQGFELLSLDGTTLLTAVTKV